MVLPSLSSTVGYSFALENYKNRLRFIVLYEGSELACRKEDAKVLSAFFQSTNEGIFQGRIRLRTDMENVIVYFKGQCLGVITKNELNRKLQHLTTD